LAKETFGTTTPLYQRFNYNVRQQLFAVRVGTNGSSAYDNNPQGGFSSQPTSWDRGFLLWHYGANDYTDWGWSGTNNNGNVLRAHQYIPCPWAGGGYCNVFFSDYEYDGLNRVTKVNDYGVQNSVQQYDYDRWGNRTINQTYTTTSPDINKKLFTVNTTNNRLGVPSGQSGTMSFDNVGNLISDTYTNPAAGGGMVYDAENHMTSAVNGSHKYNYNASGKRVRRSIVGQGEFWMVYGLGGELVAEYNANTAPSVPVKEFGYRGGQMLVMAEGSNPKWLIQDHLGSTRMEIALGGTWNDVIRHDYLPFGEELKGSLRTAPYGYGVTPNTKQKFTGYERDGETGLDFAQARYMSSVQGRFTSVDPDGIGAAIGEPQSWNGYAYVGNRPTTLTDPSGLIWLQHRNATGDIDGYKWLNPVAPDYMEEYKKAVAEGWEIAAWNDGLTPFEYDAQCKDGECSGTHTAKYVLEPDGSHHWKYPNGAQTIVEDMAVVVGLSNIVRSAMATAWEGLVSRTTTKAMFSPLGEGLQEASPELINAVKGHGRTVVFAQPGSEELRYLNYMGAEANVGGENLTHILLRPNPSKIGVLEEFLHGTQSRLGIVDRMGVGAAEIHVKQFMLRHQKMLGLNQTDAAHLEQLIQQLKK
jgi:RHS repeat-associated protein